MQNNTETLPGIDVLNTGYGDFELNFDPNKPDEVQKAKETITDMLKRGYAIFVKQGKETFRVRKFDADKNVYIIGSHKYPAITATTSTGYVYRLVRSGFEFSQPVLPEGFPQTHSRSKSVAIATS